MEPCNYCNKKFTEKSIAIHQTECKQIYSPCSLTDSQRDVFIRKLLLQVTTMNSKMTEMQTQISYLKRRQNTQIATSLNRQSDITPTPILQWIKTIPVSQNHLEIVFRKSLDDGIKQVLIDANEVAKTIGTTIPMRAFSEKQKCIFVYVQKEDTCKWANCDTATFRKICEQLASRFIELFLLWQTTQVIDDMEQNMHFMKKVMDNTYVQQGRICKIMEDVYTSIHTDMPIV